MANNATTGATSSSTTAGTSKQSEKIVEGYLCDRIEALGGWAIKMLSDDQKGLPDRVCNLPPGRVFYVECKTTGEKMTKMQARVAKRLVGIGCNHYVADTTQDVDDIINNELND